MSFSREKVVIHKHFHVKTVLLNRQDKYYRETRQSL